jgi:putative membrane protein
MTSLRAKSGPEFDRAFLRHEAAFHKSVIGAVQSTLLPAIRNEELRALVVKVVPAFEAHMLAAQSLEKQLATTRAR